MEVTLCCERADASRTEGACSYIVEPDRARVAFTCGALRSEHIRGDICDAFCAVREDAEQAGLQILCQGARRGVWPTLAARATSAAMLLVRVLGEPGAQEVPLFAAAEPSECVSVATQRRSYRAWLAQDVVPDPRFAPAVRRGNPYALVDHLRFPSDPRFAFSGPRGGWWRRTIRAEFVEPPTVHPAPVTLLHTSGRTCEVAVSGSLRAPARCSQPPPSTA